MQNTDDGLMLSPIPGFSGQAYKGTYPDGTEVFIKMNTTPLLASLAKEQIAPKLLWSKRTQTGSMMSAQEWLNGKVLEKDEMESKQIIGILTRLHRSKLLVNQLLQLGYTIERPADLVRRWQSDSVNQVRENTYLQSIAQELLQNQPKFNEDHATIVHGDIHHTNWLATSSGMIYLTDWDTVHLTDRMFDVAHMLSHYIPRHHWKEWLTFYGYKYNSLVLSKVEWYGQLSYLYQINKCFETHNIENVNKEVYALRHFRELRGKYES
ncbi:cell cycle regulator CcrZ [Streptococcus merionis]|uniref:cell cycle regulator CcrZ n=1 Tax=Streptococcus merionis TaxID=400065 RepID=UPI0026F123AA|nr:phosphotransferase family protein [Streptococcus merionis]